ncbi:hypothetical protein [Salinarimonas soli]|uniref:DUF1653 domain-containing protein n=1 Tax=Salinarimonas soli TaxID=1638099 RepID=A0A5B2V8I8_9HYPH|nr:hypothetical protein [Salinarimonas soli]KAA2235058.1 hypothetical protein F0L46_22255 [Salinarimonas soli]
MPHRFQVGQTVIPTVYIREFDAVYEVVRLMPEDVTGEPQYRLKNVRTGIELVSREAEMRACAPEAAPLGRH